MNNWKQRWLFLVVITTAATLYFVGKNMSAQNTAGSLHLRPIQPHKTKKNSGTLSEKGANGSYKGTYVLGIKYLGQQAAGVRGVLSLQCFASNLGIPVHVVEPFISSSWVGLQRLPGDLSLALKFSNFYDFDRFNLVSAMQKYPKLSRWEDFLNHGPNKVVAVQLETSGLLRTEVIWTANGSQCYQGNFLSKYHLPKVFPCVVRIVSICCVRDDRDTEFDPIQATSMEAIYDTVFGNWKPEEVSLVFREWVNPWYVPSSNKRDCKGSYEHYIQERFSPSQQLLKHTKRYKKLFIHSSHITAVMLRFEHILYKIKSEQTPVTVESCLREIRTTVKQMNTSIFVTVDIGLYGSNPESWKYTFNSLQFSSKRASETMEAFKRTLSGLVTDVRMWENSFVQATGGIADRGYIAALQRTVASTADCIVLVGGGNFHNIVLQEYMDNHPDPSKQCIYNICVEEKHAKVYRRYIQKMNLSSTHQSDELEIFN